MKVVPIHAEVEIEHVPPDSLPGMCHDGWGIANERSSVEAKGREVVAAGFDHAVLAWPVICPGDLPTRPDGDVGRVEREIDDGHAGRTRAARLHGYGAGHAGPVNATDVVVSRRNGEKRR